MLVFPGKPATSTWMKTTACTANCYGPNSGKVYRSSLTQQSHHHLYPRVKQTSHSKGQHAENACCEYLKQQGLTLLEQNYRGPHGEIDIVMKDKNTLVFVEVRYRKNDDYGGALESITSTKQARILATAEQYLQRETRIKNARIDVVAMSQKPQNKATEQSSDEYSFDWIKNAFS